MRCKDRLCSHICVILPLASVFSYKVNRNSWICESKERSIQTFSDYFLGTLTYAMRCCQHARRTIKSRMRCMSKAKEKGLYMIFSIRHKTLVDFRKCDQKKPFCGRCKRLHLTCTGAGQQRYIFVREYAKSTSSVRKPSYASEPPPISTTPSNEKSLAVAATVSLLQVTDLRYDVSVYGEFLRLLPQRLGYNQALDSAAQFMVLAFPSLYTERVSVQALASYGTALRHIHRATQDQAQANSVELFCAIFLVAVFQVRPSRGSKPLSMRAHR